MTSMTSMKHDLTFGNRIRSLRKKYRLTQLELSAKVEIPKSTLAGYENGLRRPKFETIEKLAEVLHTSSDYLIGISDDPHPSKPTKDLRKLLKQEDYHIDGKKLTNEDLDFVIEFLDRIAQNKTDKSNNENEFSDENFIETEEMKNKQK